MPFYTWLRPRSGEGVDVLNNKQRTVQKIKALRAALKAHIAAIAPSWAIPVRTSSTPTMGNGGPTRCPITYRCGSNCASISPGNTWTMSRRRSSRTLRANDQWKSGLSLKGQIVIIP